MSRYLITGATGFIGSHLAEMLVGQGHFVRCLVRESSDVSWLNSLRVELASGCFSDHRFLNETVSDVNVVVHLAGLTSAFTLKDLLKVNRDNTYHLAQACSRQQSPPIHVVVSSIAAAGPVASSLKLNASWLQTAGISCFFHCSAPASDFSPLEAQSELACIFGARQMQGRRLKNYMYMLSEVD